MIEGKVLKLDALAELSSVLRSGGKRVVLCHGVFDLMHAGHIRHLQRAAQEGDVLMVTVTADQYVNKGPGRPVFNEILRAETLAALACVSYVAVNHAPTAINVIELIKPSVYVKGSDYKSVSEDLTGNISKEVGAVEANGGKVVFTDEITFSSSNLLNEHFGVFSDETREFLSDFKKRHTASSVIDHIKSLSRLNVLVVGDAIVDEYHYTHPLGQSGKGNVLAVKYTSREQFAGGAIAVANHVAGFVNSVTLLTGLGETRSHEEFIRAKLASNVTPVFFYYKNAPTITKRRFVDPDMAKLFEVYFFEEEPRAGGSDEDICEWLGKESGKFDVVVTPDFGNGFVTNNMVAILAGEAKFLAVNTQINSGNRGYHVINKYPRADFISLNEPEIRLAAHNRHDALETVAGAVGDRLQAGNLAVTRGTLGAMWMDKISGMTYNVPALSTKVVDRIGAGDAFLSLAGSCLGGGVPPEVCAFVASSAAALDVQIVCNREPVSPVALFKYITTLLK